MVKIFAKFALIFFFCLISLVYPHLSYANAVSLPFSDDFEDDNIFDNWSYISGNWSLEAYDTSTWLGLHSGSSSDNEIQIGDTNLTNYEFDIDVHKIEGEDLNFFFRVQPKRYTNLPGHNIPTGYGLHMKHERFALQKFTTSEGVEIPSAIVAESFLNNTVKNVRIKLEGNNIKVFTENSNVPIINYSDNDNPFLDGGVALASITGGAGTDFQFDNFHINNIEPPPSPSPSPTPTPTFPSLAVPDIKQYSLPWKNQVYDKAWKWADDTTIDRWGCALTSASMILKFWGHGDYANPDKLNNWLKSQTDGYLGDGYVNWLAVARYSLIHSTPTIPALEYSRLDGTKQNLVNEIENGRPSILKVPNHFVVAKGQTSDSFEINDPAFPDKPTLESYGNNFSSINSFIPTHTDLSYLLLTIDPKFDLKVYDDNDNEISGDSYIEDPLTDDITNASSEAKLLKVFLLKKPSDEKYKVEISGNKGKYLLTSYVYDKKGNVTKDSEDGRLSRRDSKDTIIVKTSTKKKKHFSKFPWPPLPPIPWQ